MEKINIEQITESKEFKEIIGNENLSEVFFTLLQDFVTKYSDEYNTQRSLACRLYIYYLKYQNKLGYIENIYEKALLNFVGFFSLSEDTFRFLLSQDIDLDYEGTDMYGTPSTLKDSLALGLANPNLMGVFLDLINSSEIKTFGNIYYELFTDTVHMNVIAGRIGESIKQFESPEYNLFREDNDKVIESIRKNNCPEVQIDSIQIIDKVSSIIKTTRGALIPRELKRAYLNTIIYSPKIKLLNRESLSNLKEILTEEEWSRFVSYLKIKLESSEIVLYSVKSNNVIHLETLESVLNKEEVKTLRYQLPENN